MGTACQLGLCRDETFAQLLQGVPSGKDGHEQTILLQGAANLDERAGRVVGLVQRHE